MPRTAGRPALVDPDVSRGQPGAPRRETLHSCANPELEPHLLACRETHEAADADHRPHREGRGCGEGENFSAPTRGHPHEIHQHGDSKSAPLL